MSGIVCILKKELARVFTDKKMIINLFIIPAVLVIGIYSLIGYLAGNMVNDIDTHKGQVYINNIPKGLKEIIQTVSSDNDYYYFTGDNYEGKSIEDIKNDILNGNVDLLVCFDENFYDLINNYSDKSSIPEVKTFYNPSEDYSSNARTMFINQVLESYKQQILVNRIGDLDKLTIFNIDVTNAEASVIMDDNKASGKILGQMLPYLIIILLFSGAMGLCIDAITGEKERGTLSSMLITPLKRHEIVIGKLLSLSILSGLSAMIYAVSMIIAMPMMMKSVTGGEELGFNINFTFVQIIGILFIMVTLVFLFVGLISIVAVYARTSKEASTLSMPMYMIAIVAGIMTMFGSSTDIAIQKFAIPIYGAAIAMQQILMSDINFLQIGVVVIVNLIITGILILLITKAFNSEKIMFNA